MSVLSNNSTRDKSLTIIALAMGAFLVSQGETWLDPYTARIVNLVAINAILAVSLNLIYGFTGMFSLGHAGFMAIGAYVCTLFILSPEQKTGQWILEPILPFLENISLPFFFAVLAGGLVAAFFGVLIAVPVLRLGGDYLGIATLGFAEIIRVLIVNNAPITNGALGIKGIPQYSTMGWNFLWLGITVYVIMTLLKSNIGNVFKAIREDEIASQTMGVNIFWYKILSFALGAFFAGVGGGLMAALVSTIDPTMFKFLQTFNILMIVVAGGLGSVTGSLIGSAVITFFLEWLRLVEDATTLHFPPAWTDMAPMFSVDIPGIPGMRMVIFSVLLMCIILYWRKGLLGTREFSWEGTIFRPLRLIKNKLLGNSNAVAVDKTVTVDNPATITASQFAAESPAASPTGSTTGSTTASLTGVMSESPSAGSTTKANVACAGAEQSAAEQTDMDKAARAGQPRDSMEASKDDSQKSSREGSPEDSKEQTPSGGQNNQEGGRA